MQLIQRLINTDTVSKSGNSKTRQMGLFFCPKCKQQVTKDLYNGKKIDTCGAKGCQKNRSFRHGYAHTSMYRAWANMKARCDNPKAASYEHYGDKGISYPETWKTFKGFYAEMFIGYKEGLTIDRIDIKKSYSKENCQWISMKENRVKDQIKTIAKLDNNDNVIIVYSSAADAVRAGECKTSTCITRVARGERKTYKGFHWKYL